MLKPLLYTAEVLILSLIAIDFLKLNLNDVFQPQNALFCLDVGSTP
jgi:hypothetical protein